MNDLDTPETPSIEEQVKMLKEENKKLKQENQTLTDCLLEMSEIVYGGGV